MISKTFAALAAVALVAGSGAAAAQTAQPLSIANAPAVDRAGADSSELGSRGYGIYIIGAIALALIIYGAIELLGDDEPNSP
jgi:hypothetical protein